MGKVHSLQASSVGWRHRSTAHSILRVEDGRGDRVGAEAVTEATGKVGEPIQRKQDRVVRVATVGHGNAHKSDIETSESHEPDNATG